MSHLTDLSFTLTRVDIAVKRVPIDVPVQTSFGMMMDRPAVFLKATSADGSVGLGEIWCNFPACGAEHRARLLETVILPSVIGTEFADPATCFTHLDRHFQKLAAQTGEFGPIAQCLAGLDGAIWDMVARRAEVPLFRLLGGADPQIGVYASGINPKGTVENAHRLQAQGHRALKLKIGFGETVDFENIRGICSGLDTDTAFMVDANQAWSLTEAKDIVLRLAEFPIRWLEEPMLVSTPAEDWRALAEVCEIPLAGGENLASTAAFAEVIDGDWLDVIQPDLCKWGGISACLPVAHKALAAGKRLCPHFLGGGIGLAASAHLLAAVGGGGLLEIDSNPNPLRDEYFSPEVSNGHITLSERPGLGIPMEQF